MVKAVGSRGVASTNKPLLSAPLSRDYYTLNYELQRLFNASETAPVNMTFFVLFCFVFLRQFDGTSFLS